MNKSYLKFFKLKNLSKNLENIFENIFEKISNSLTKIY